MRHGQVENPNRLRYGNLPGFPLSPRGRIQVARTARSLQGRLPQPPLLLSSPLERAMETAQILGKCLQTRVCIDPRLREIGSRYDGLPWGFSPLAFWRRRIDPTFGGYDEPIPLAASRLLESLREAQLAHPGEIVVVSHQLPLRAALLVLTQGLGALDGPLPAPLWLRLKQPLALGYAEVVELVESGEGRWRITGVFGPGESPQAPAGLGGSVGISGF
ncbi:MAG: histidine phosphatase family protein [Myxococcales bacterium]|nr:histidine phosphatase family protein [Polyangiaceae bacterium]MDW8249588.1 histidine phosphatase family protein [Myxococcales bacterium]